MKILKMTGTSLISVMLLSSCDSGNKNISVENAKSAQKAAEEYSKSFNNTPAAHKIKTANTDKKAAPDGAGIVGLPKVSVEGAKTVVKEISNAGEAALNATKSAVGELYEDATDTVKGGVEGAKSAMNKPDNNEDKALNSTSSTSAQEAAAELSKETPAKTTNKDNTKPTPASAGIVGFPKEAVEVAKTIVEETKDVATKAVETISGTDEPPIQP